MRTLKQLSLAALLAAAHAGAGAAPLELDGLFQDHMVLPRHEARVSGRAAAGERITVSAFGQTRTAMADAAGRFSVALPELAAGRAGALNVTAASGAQVTVNDVLTGDVHLCSGQSNMQVPVTRALNSDVVIGNSANPQLRMATVAVSPSPTPLSRFASPLKWEAASPQTVAGWSATCYFFGAALQQRTGVPIGLVHASLGGSALSAWLSPGASLPDYAKQQELLKLHARDAGLANVAFARDFEQWWRSTGGSGAPWASTAGALQAWRPVPDVSQPWEKWGVPELAAYDGAVWYAAAVELTPTQAAQAARLELGLIDDIDLTWLNGQPVGFTSGGGTQRRYAVPAGALKAGLNTVVVNVVDLWSYGGFYGDGPRELVLADGTKLPLVGWRWQPVPAAQKSPPRAPWDAMAGISVLHNGMLAPMGLFRFESAVWYQGESNVGQPYQRWLSRLFTDWRAQFGDGLLFAVVQLANYGARNAQPVESGWALLREEQRRAVAADRHAVLATAVDLGEPTDIHPANKEVLGRRLARAVAIALYGEKGSASGPAPRAAVREGERVIVSFDGLEGDWLVYGGPRPIGFELCGSQGCRWAEAEVSGRDVVLRGLPGATKVRYCWSDAPTCTLYDGGSQLPALPFEQVISP
ncbi:sialate O-acetylesterase [Roseateles cellulosilyticus]|uniref:Sialate O-acetylesterase domain-containing protein n=1 Tax=Pelomonas cellulosilytica TaxID=2906762 RepID=A0ABS8XZ00_9BURK|nr:sialate O-acetylesterase [Pelomonas sp. P8]MCE4555928.1 hypothetical protein [Pelomonas sp. P8]